MTKDIRNEGAGDRRRAGSEKVRMVGCFIGIFVEEAIHDVLDGDHRLKAILI